jgi:predicted transcriptional regulator
MAAGTVSTEVLIAHAADIVTSYVAKNSVNGDDLPALIQSVYAAWASVGQESSAPERRLEPAVSIRSSLKPDHLVCLEDGKKMKMLKRHLRTDHGLTPDEYRARWGLASDYPMVAPEYADKRRELAKKIGLGRIPASAGAGAKRVPKHSTQRD